MNGQRAIDRDALASLGGKVRPEGGAQDILRLIDQVKAGTPISLESLE